MDQYGKILKSLREFDQGLSDFLDVPYSIQPKGSSVVMAVLPDEDCEIDVNLILEREPRGGFQSLSQKILEHLCDHYLGVNERAHCTTFLDGDVTFDLVLSRRFNQAGTLQNVHPDNGTISCPGPYTDWLCETHPDLKEYHRLLRTPTDGLTYAAPCVVPKFSQALISCKQTALALSQASKGIRKVPSYILGFHLRRAFSDSSSVQNLVLEAFDGVLMALSDADRRGSLYRQTNPFDERVTMNRSWPNTDHEQSSVAFQIRNFVNG